MWLQNFKKGLMKIEELVEDVALLIVGLQDDSNKELMKRALSDSPDSLRAYVNSHLMRRIQVLVARLGAPISVPDRDQVVTLILERLKKLL